MTATHAGVEGASGDHIATERRPTPTAEAPAPDPTPPFLSGNPAALGLPVFVAGTVALALVLVGYVPTGGLGSSMPIIATATGFGLAVSTVWAAALGQSAVASIFGIFSGFWLSYAALVLGLTHNWFAITPNAALHTQAAFLITWLVIIGMLTLATLRLPFAFTLLFVLVEACLVCVLISTVNASSTWSKIAGIVAFAFAAVGVYLYMGVSSVATGGKALALGRPVVH
ncbi:GPR1/FUN34/YaaH family transporter [uncultured Jatrophihabitans sp.]|uniref:GPR1/FUN34/YaaH family transporter n=1 Tax=uncultured Jatrophihabitans sp. TaxID=1610747 RepID=UPI0035CBA3BE